MMRVYYDNMIVSGRIREDLHPSEMAALAEIERLHHEGKRLKRVTSRESWREQEKTRDPVVRATLIERQDEMSAVSYDHVLLGFNHVSDQTGGFITSPLLDDIIDRPLFSRLQNEYHLSKSDARHFMYAGAPENNCQVFLTTDPHFLDQRAALQALCPQLCILRPSELVAELGVKSQAG